MTILSSAKRLRTLCCSVLFMLGLGVVQLPVRAQQVIERGPFGKPVRVVDETQRWSIPILMYEDPDVEMYVPDVTSAEWIQAHEDAFFDKGQYTVSLYSFYKTQKVCRREQVLSGQADENHLEACANISYKVRQISVNVPQRNITVLSSYYVDTAGQLYPELPTQRNGTRPFNDVDDHTREALKKTTEVVAREMATLKP